MQDQWMGEMTIKGYESTDWAELGPCELELQTVQDVVRGLEPHGDMVWLAVRDGGEHS